MFALETPHEVHCPFDSPKISSIDLILGFINGIYLYSGQTYSRPDKRRVSRDSYRTFPFSVRQ